MHNFIAQIKYVRRTVLHNNRTNQTLDSALFSYTNNKRNLKIRADWKREKERKKEGKREKNSAGLTHNDALPYRFWKTSNRFTTFTVKIKNNNEPGDNKRQ